MDGEIAFDELMASLRAGDDGVAARVYRRFAGKLIRQARRKLPRAVRQKEDEQDVLQSAMATFFKHVRRGEFQLENWDSLEALLVLITVRKCVRRVERYGTGRRDGRREVSQDDLTPADESSAGWQPLAREPTPAEAAILVETVERLFAGLADERHRRIVRLRLEGFSTAEIGVEVGRTQRMVRRVLEEVRRRMERWLEDEGARRRPST